MGVMPQATPFQKEAWSEYALGVCVIMLRIFSRIKVVGFKNWQGDDYFAILALIFWTVSFSSTGERGQERQWTAAYTKIGRTGDAGIDRYATPKRKSPS